MWIWQPVRAFDEACARARQACVFFFWGGTTIKQAKVYLASQTSSRFNFRNIFFVHKHKALIYFTASHSEKKIRGPTCVSTFHYVPSMSCVLSYQHASRAHVCVSVCLWFCGGVQIMSTEQLDQPQSNRRKKKERSKNESH